MSEPMSEASPRPAYEPRSGPRTGGRDRPSTAALIAGPLLALAAGLGIGYAVWGAGDEAGDRDAERVVSLPPPAPPAPPSIATTEVRAQVPTACVEAVAHAEKALRLVEQGVAAAGRLDARELERLLAEVGPLQPLLRESAATCRQGVTVGDAPPAPAPS